MDFGNIIKTLRIEKDYAQKDIAALLGVSQQAYSNYEAGRREPDILVLCKLADIFRVSLDYLLGRTDEPQRIFMQPVALPAANSVTADEQEALDLLRSLNAEGFRFALSMLRTVAATEQYKKHPVSQQIQEIG